jgi:hypothetical protein
MGQHDEEGHVDQQHENLEKRGHRRHGSLWLAFLPDSRAGRPVQATRDLGALPSSLTRLARDILETKMQG